MRTFNITVKQQDGSSAVKAVRLVKRFSAYVNGRQFTFALHEPAQGMIPLVVSEWHTGLRLGDTGTGASTLRSYAQLTEKERGELVLMKLQEKHGEARVFELLQRAVSQAGQHDAYPMLNPKFN